MDSGIRRTPSRLCSQDSRLRFYGGTVYGSVHWVHLDPVTNPPPRRRVPEEDDRGLGTAVDRFSRLPDDVIVHHVFDKMPELKTLFSVSLVSKHFASLVFQVQSVSMKLANWGPTVSPSTFLSRAREHIFIPVRVHLFKPACPFFTGRDRVNFLKRFSCIRSLSIDLSYDKGVAASSPSFDQAQLLRWRFDKNGFVLLSAKHREDSSSTGVGVDDAETMAAAAVDALYSMQCLLLDGVFRLAFAALLIEDIPHLKSVSVRDCLGRGRVELDEEFIGDIRSASGEAIHDSEPSCLKMWRLGAVKLLLTGCVMKDVTLCVVKDDDGVEDGLLVDNAFGEDVELGELARRVLKEEARGTGTFLIS